MWDASIVYRFLLCNGFQFGCDDGGSREWSKNKHKQIVFLKGVYSGIPKVETMALIRTM
jgi:hypothetical protein